MLEKTINHVKSTNDGFESSPSYSKILPIKTGNKIVFVQIGEIKYILAARCYSEVYTNDKKYVVRKPLNKIIIPIKKDCFVRIHRSTIINKDFVRELICSSHGEIDVVMQDKEKFRVGRSYKDDLLKDIGFL